MIACAKGNVADRALTDFTRLVSLNDIRRIKGSGPLARIRPQYSGQISDIGRVARLCVELLLEGGYEILGNRVFVLQRPPKARGAINALHDICPDFLFQKG